MTRKDYQMIAAAMWAAKRAIQNKELENTHSAPLDGVSYACDYIADALQRDNPRFDRTRFLKACGIE